MANENNGAKKEEKKSFITKVKEGIKTLPEKHPRVAKAGKVTVTVGKTAIKAAFVAGAGTVAALTILDKTKGKSYATLPGVTKLELENPDVADVVKAAEDSGMKVEEVGTF